MLPRVRVTVRTKLNTLTVYFPLTIVLKGGTKEDDYCNGVAMANDGSVIVAGESSGDWDDIKVGFDDFVAVKLNAAGEQIWVWLVSHVRSLFSQ